MTVYIDGVLVGNGTINYRYKETFHAEEGTVVIRRCYINYHRFNTSTLGR